MQNSGKRASIYLGIFLAIVMGAGAILPLLRSSGNGTTTATEATATVLPTFPAPPADFSSISFNQVYLHPSGIFSIGQPDGWTASNSNNGASIDQVNLINNDQLAVVDTYVEAPATPITPDELSAHFTESVMNASWANFTTWQETNRSMDGDRLVIDFSVVLQSRTFVARQIVWTDGTWIYVVRVLVPENATDYLRYLLDNFVSTLQPQTEFQGTPLEWSAYYDPDVSHIIRYPSNWSVTDSAPGRPTSITSAEGSTLLRVESRANTSVADEAAASAYVESERSGISVVSVAPVTRGLGQGFSVAYTYTNVDGDQQSGLSVLLNGADGTLHTANLLFSASGIDLNSVQLSTPSADATPEASTSGDAQAYVLLAEVMNTFYVIEPLNLSAQSLPATPTPVPTVAPTATPEVTAEMTVEATVEPSAVATPEPTAEATVAQ